MPNYFGCGHLGLSIRECIKISTTKRDKSKEEFPYSLTLKAESNLMGKESLLFGSANRKVMKQCSYIGKVVAINKPIKRNKKDKILDLATVVEHTVEEKWEATTGWTVLETPNLARDCRDFGNSNCSQVKDANFKPLDSNVLILVDEYVLTIEKIHSRLGRQMEDSTFWPKKTHWRRLVKDTMLEHATLASLMGEKEEWF